MCRHMPSSLRRTTSGDTYRVSPRHETCFLSRVDPFLFFQAVIQKIQPVQSADYSGLDESACHIVKNIRKPCAGKPQARFDE